MSMSINLPEVLALHAKWRPQKAAFCDDKRQVTWQEFDHTTNRIAHSLLEAGCNPGDKIAVLMSNSIEMTQILFGIAKAGCCSVPLNISVDNHALANMIKDAEAKIIYVSTDHAGRINTEKKIEIIAATETGFPDEFINSLPENIGPPPHSHVAENAMNIIYSSGTTGLPKGIIATFEGRKNWAYDLALEYNFHSETKTLIATGLYSNISWATMLATLLVGGTIIVSPNKFDADETVRRISHHKITHTAMVPVQYQRIMEISDHRDLDLSSIECAITVGAPMHIDLKRNVHAKLSGNLYEIYGLTEGIITIMRGSEMPDNWTSVGRPLLGSDIAILDDNDQLVDNGTVGEIIGNSPFIMPGYHARPDASKDVFWYDHEDRKWLRTGDIGFIDKNGYLSIVDRKKDMILSGGQNIYPADIEAELLKHPSIIDAAVVGIPNKKWGETPLALVVKSKTCQQPTDDIKAVINASLGRQQRISYLEYIDELPRNPNGKILKRELRETYRDKYYE
ncbi:class I adenylate-forming enzyme family protein [Kordiimonas sp. SCSIO 12610]|uniref:class I adenylate-forming enzyme family protein n=1 Tax=Kordiimonas sp. SCSIO 12610 TaxID=2829597 RepID=UPI00210E74D6|nr:class I adenylate-forming enzyme family protein [Kordiimonas sp. SCSIO 12610]UTW54714.1 acyl--CoA ligase [Kordiimonas sp. SCSIO 12610]